uniref:Glucagon / GIP / secretin / VIP family domain-containing protein n=1 Tax=Lates calcarifer TaxID=8187 RepID=A0A4W6DGD6_LATCA
CFHCTGNKIQMHSLLFCCFLCRSKHHADGLFTSSYSKLLSQLTATNYLESLIPKRVNGDLMENQSPVKRHSDAVFTNKYSRYRKKMAAKKWLIAMLQGKRRGRLYYLFSLESVDI